MSKREATKASNRAAILDAARRVFGELGYGAASVRDIIRRTDLAAGTFYNYFPDKESIFLALVEEVGDEARRRVRDARRSATGVESFVADSYRAYFEYVVEDPDRSAFLARNTGAIRAEFDDVVLPQAGDELIEDLRAGIEAGLLPGDFDVQYMASAMTSVGVELGVQLLRREPPDVEGATRFASQLFLAALQRGEPAT